MIDVGGPTMIRAAAKNFRGVTVVVDPGDYTQVLAALRGRRAAVPEPLRRGLATEGLPPHPGLRRRHRLLARRARAPRPRTAFPATG